MKYLIGWKMGKYLIYKKLPITRGISHGWVCADSTSRISSQPQFRSDTQTLV